MAIKWTRGAALALSLGLASGLFSVAPAAQAAERATSVRTVGTFSYSAQGIPASLRRGGTIHARITYVERSPERMLLEGLYVPVFAPTRSARRGVNVRWRNPFTGRWQNSTRTDRYGDFWLDLATVGREIVMKPGVRYHIDVQITFSKAAPVGTWSVFPQILGTYQMINSHGTPNSDEVDLAGGEYNVKIKR